MEKSKGHICFIAHFEFFIRNGNAYRAIAHWPIMPDGYRSGRWECKESRLGRFIRSLIETYPVCVCLSAEVAPSVLLPVSDLHTAQVQVEEYIVAHGLVAEQFTGGQLYVTDMSGEPQLVGMVSCDGRIWAGEDFRIQL